MPSLASISLAIDGWTLLEETASQKVWSNEAGDTLFLNYYAGTPDLTAPLSDISTIRNQFRRLMNRSGGALVTVEIRQIAGMEAVHTLVKSRNGSGTSYLGGFILPYRDFSFSIQVKCTEQGMTGIREALVAQRLHQETGDDPARARELLVDKWEQDPYDSTYRAPLLRNRADDEEWDTLLPDHHLSRVRATLRKISETCTIDEELRSAEKFQGPPAGWWSKWRQWLTRR